MNTKYIIVPDIHGRDFWKNIVNEHLNDDTKIIFLGDYLDPYDYEENIPLDNGYANLCELIELKKSNPDKFVLLMGNHDIHYISTSRDGRGSRYDWENSARNAQVFNDNINCFQMTYSCEINGKTFLFSHAGIIPAWLEQWENIYGIPEDLGDDLNDYFSNLNNLPDFTSFLRLCDSDKDPNTDGKEDFQKRHMFFRSLSYISSYRGGYNVCGSMVWADSREHFYENNRIPRVIQIFGHSQQEKDPVNYDNVVYCLDVRRGFCIDDSGNVCELDGTIIPSIDREAEDKRLKEAEKRELEFIKKYGGFFL